MIDQDKVRLVVARFFNVPEATVTENFMFPADRLHGSVGRATFHAAIKRMAGADLPSAMSAKTFGELFQQPSTPADAGKSANAESPVAPPANSSGITLPPSVVVGIDIEHIDHMPAVSDPWSETFYTDNFTPAEIAYCQRQPNPRESFCGIWCAKEAAMKRGYMNRRPLELEIMHDAQGRPMLAIVNSGQSVVQRSCDVSISHSHGFSVAVVVSGTSPVGSSRAAPQKISASGANGLAWLALGLSGLSLLLWLWLLIKK